jgi:hypothetical protein
MARLAPSHVVNHPWPQSNNFLFIITTIAQKSSTWTWRPMCWSKRATPSQPLTHSSPSFLPFPSIPKLCPLLSMPCHLVTCSDDTYTMSPITLACTQVFMIESISLSSCTTCSFHFHTRYHCISCVTSPVTCSYTYVTLIFKRTLVLKPAPHSLTLVYAPVRGFRPLRTLDSISQP